MKIISFNGVNVNEYINTSIKFNKKLTIIVGSNGTGKTTSLSLLHAVFELKIDVLIRIPFDSLDIEFENGVSREVITVVKDKKDLIISHKFSNEDIFDLHYSPMKLPLKMVNDYDLFSKDSELNHKLHMFLKKDYEANLFSDSEGNPIKKSVIEYLRKLPKIKLLGLERIENVREDYKDYLYERNLLLRHSNKQKESTLKNKDVGISALETEMLIQETYRRVKSIQDFYSNKINKSLISSSFDFMEIDSEFLLKNTDKKFIREKFKSLSKKGDIKETLTNIGFLSNDLSDKLDHFFTKMEKLSSKFDSKNQAITLEWLINLIQIDRMDKVFGMVEDYNEKANNAFKPVVMFLNTINSFFKDTGKKVIIDEVGRLFIEKPKGRKLTIDELSSGERQLVVLFANVIFNKYTMKGAQELIIIDEPEISLHIKWQDSFIDKLLEVSSNTQFIIATHSPDIIGEFKQYALNIGK